MPGSDPPNGTPKPGFDARKELEEFGPPRPQPGPDITMGLPTSPDLRSDDARHDVAGLSGDDSA
jgi:hypothetical protein